MALASPVVRGLDTALCNKGAAADVVGIVDADTGTLADKTKLVLKQVFGKADAAHLIATIDSGAGGVPVGYSIPKVFQALGRAKGNDFLAEIAGNA